MSTPANLYPGLNDLSDIFEEIPIEITKYLTLLHEIDAKCTNLLPTLTGSIDKLLNNNNDNNKPTLMEINTLLEELMPSLEEKMHVSSLMCELINRLDKRLELAYEVAIRNEEIPSSVRLGLDNHPAMHLHHELVQSLNNPPHSQRNTRSTQNTRNESKRETQSNNNNNNNNNNSNNSNSNINNNNANSNSNRKEKQSSLQENNKKSTTNTSSSSSSSNTAHNNNNNNNGNSGGASTTTSSKRRSNNSNSSNQSNGNSNANSSTSRQQKGSSKNNSKSTNHTATPTPRVNEYGEPVYCYCNQVAYGEMVGCDGENCELEWFHLPCIGLTTLPKGKWYCDTCKAKLRRSS